MVKWTLEDTIETYKLGWSIFHTDEGEYLIQSLDDPDMVEWEHNIKISERFNGEMRDAQPAARCQEMANAGNPICRKAIEFLIYEDSPDVFSFQLERTW